MEDVLASLSHTLPDAFDETINRIQRLPDSRKQLGMNALLWISHAKRPLLVIGLAEVLSIKSGQNTVNWKHCTTSNVLLACCQGLATIDQESSIIRLAHYSVQEYLIEHSQNLFHSAEASLAETCMKYLLFDTFNSGPWEGETDVLDLIQHNPFLMYAASFWGVHVQLSEGDPNIQDLTTSFMQQHNAVAAAYQVTQVLNQRRDIYWCAEECLSLTPLHISSHFGLTTITQLLLIQSAFAVDAITVMGTTPLIKAAFRGHVSLVRLLLQKGADPYMENWYGNALHCAAEAGQCDTIRELIKHGMSPNTYDKAHELVPLDCTLDNSHVATFETLVDLGADIRLSNDQGLTVIQEAVRQNCVKIIDLMLQRGWTTPEELCADSLTQIPQSKVTLRRKITRHYLYKLSDQGSAAAKGFSSKYGAPIGR